MISKYWSNSRFADWLRGTKKPQCGTVEEWTNWEKSASKNHSFRYWLTETALCSVQRLVHYIPDKLDNIRYYINNRWVTKNHVMKTRLSKGAWHEYDTRLIHAMFEELVDFVEIEQAWIHVVWNEKSQAKFNLPWWRKKGFCRAWRCPEAGIEHLYWASNLKLDESCGINPGNINYGKLTSQAKAARTILKLYRWWKEVYLTRPDVDVVSGWAEFYDKNPEPVLSVEKEKESRAILKRLDELEFAREEEDTKMMIELVKLRKHLWT